MHELHMYSVKILLGSTSEMIVEFMMVRCGRVLGGHGPGGFSFLPPFL